MQSLQQCICFFRIPRKSIDINITTNTIYSIIYEVQIHKSDAYKKSIKWNLNNEWKVINEQNLIYEWNFLFSNRSIYLDKGLLNFNILISYLTMHSNYTQKHILAEFMLDIVI